MSKSITPVQYDRVYDFVTEFQLDYDEVCSFVRGESVLISSAELRRLSSENETLRAQLAARVPTADKVLHWFYAALAGDASRKEMERRVRELLSAAPSQQAQPKTNPCGETCERAKLCAICAQGIEPSQQAPVAQGEPVAEFRGVTDDGRYLIKLMGSINRGALLYTHPQQASEPMTDEQVRAGFKSMKAPAQTAEEWFADGARFAERHHNIKGKQ